MSASLTRFIVNCWNSRLTLLSLAGALFATSSRSLAAPDLSVWQPLFKGIEHLGATNSISSGDFNNRMVAHVLRVDLQDSDIRLLSTPRIANYEANVRETGGRTVSRFLQVNHLQVAINANFFDPSDYYLAEGTPMTVRGLAISDGLQVSAVSGTAPTLLVNALNQARIVATNSPPANTADSYTAVTGDYPLVVNGVNIGRKYLNIGGFVHEPNPRTAVGLSEDRRYLYLLTVDGRQPGYSEGAYDYETGAWLKLFGAHDGMNLDGGGSTTMVMQSSVGTPQRLNRPSAVADSGRERTVGSHLGVFAKPLVSFINQVAVQPDDETAVVTWTTASPATSQVEYGLNEEMNLVSLVQATNMLDHQVLLTGLKPGTGYFYRAISTAAGIRYASSNLFFTTTNYATLRVLVNTTNSWKFTSDNLDGINWTTLAADESAWSGPGAGLLWADVRSTGPNPDVQPKGQQLAVDIGNTGFPYPTYYFRNHFTFEGKAPNISLSCSAFVDDGAVFYLNGQEVYRLRMDEAPVPIFNDTLAAGTPCAGDATCSDEFTLSDAQSELLQDGENVLAVEVHNYNPRSSDITFGLTLTAAIPRSLVPKLSIAAMEGGLGLSWFGSGYFVQQAEAPGGPWTNVPGPVTTSPYVTEGNGTTRYFRLSR